MRWSLAASRRYALPHAALLDIDMPADRRSRRSRTPWPSEVPSSCRFRSVILTTFGRPGYLRRAMESGACGFVVKDAPDEQP